MPSTYAHYRFGKQVLPTLPQDVQQCIGRFRRMYDMGLQGPDFLFYHNPFAQTNAVELGNIYHHNPGKEFFTAACKAATSEAALAYLYGLLGHYCLDSAVHPFVNRKDEEGPVSHVAMEKEFERYLMAMDGIAEPHCQPLGEKIKLTRGECVTVAAFFPPVTPGEVNRSVIGMASCLNFLARRRSGFRYDILQKFFPNLLEHAVPREGDKTAERTNSELLARYNRCLKAYPEMLAQLEDHRKNDTPLGDLFEPSFG